VPEGDGSHVAGPSSPEPVTRSRGRWLRRTTAGLVVLVLLAAGAAYQFELGPRWFGFDYPSAVDQPAEVLPPPGLELPKARAAASVAPPAAEKAVDGEAVRRALAPLLRSKKLGPHVVVDVAQLSDGTSVYRTGAGPVTPASTMKLLTTTAALEAVGPDHRFTIEVVAVPGSSRIVLVGGGDPLLTRAPVDEPGAYPQQADLDTLAGAVARSLKVAGRHRVRLSYDTSLFTGPQVNPRWEPNYVPDDVVSPITALWVDEGRETRGLSDRSADPAAAAAQVFARALERRGIDVVGRIASRPAPTEQAGGAEIAAVRSAPLAQIVQHVLEVSDNEGAEVLARQVAVATDRPGSFSGATQAVRAVLGELGVDTRRDRILNGSGLSRQNRLSPATLLAVLQTASSPDHPELRPVVADVPVAGFTGSLAFRFDTGDSAGLGTVRAKTGTLTGVHGLAGTVTSVDGAVMTFVAVADRVRERNNLDARVLVDRMAAALAGCTCAATP